MSRGHYIKRNDRTESLQHAIFYDTETNPQEIDTTTIGHVLKQGWAAYMRRTRNGKWSEPEWFRFETRAQFWAWVELKARKKTKLYLFCHNTNFDMPVLDAFNELPKRGWVPDRLVIEGPPTIVRVRKNQRTLLFLDTLNWWAIPLAKLGQSVGLPKLTMPDDTASVEEWDVYNKRDVEIIMAAVTQWADMVREYDLGGFQPTLASQAFAAWRHQFMTTPVWIDNHDRALACARECYHGGRTEAFYIGKLSETYHLLDINGMYPDRMRSTTYPTVLRHFSVNQDVGKLRYLLRQHKVCAQVQVTVDQPAIGVYKDKRFIFPTGTFNAYLSTPELKWVLKHGKINRVYQVAAYEHAHLFRRFVDTMYKWREQFMATGNEVWAYMVKILMNSLYGKYGQRGIRYEDEYTVNDYSIDTWTEVNFQTGDQEKYRQLMGVVQRLVREGESANSHPAIAAHVTAEARMHLFNYMTKAGLDNVFYSDTDSLLVNDAGLERLSQFIHPTQLGALKHEGTYDDCEIYGAKDYRFGNKVRTKGVRSTALWLTPNTIEQEKWAGLKGLLRNNSLDMPLTTIIEKTLTRDYLKGRVTDSGRVVPWVLGVEAPSPTWPDGVRVDN